MANKLTDNKALLQQLLQSVQNIAKANTEVEVSSINNKTGDVTIGLSDFGLQPQEWGFTLKDTTTLTKNVIVSSNSTNAIDFSKIRSLTIPEGKVKKIYHGDIVLWKELGLPEEYQRVTYIRKALSSNAYLDLGFAFDTEATIHINYTKHTSTSSYLFGAAENSGVLRCMITDGETLYGYGSTGSANTGVSLTSGETSVEIERNLKYTIKNKNLRVEDTALSQLSSKNTSNTTFVMTNNLYLFGQNYNGSPRVSGDFSVSSFKYYDKDNKLICELIPCLRKSDREIGMYDIVRGIFLTATSTDGKGTFTRGELIDGEEIVWKNWAKYATEADDITIYNNGQGYKDGYRIRSAGAETEASGCSCTGYIPAKAGDIIRLAGYPVSTVSTYNAINVYNASHTHIGQAASNGNYGIFASAQTAYGYSSITENPAGLYTWVVPPDSNIAYIRVNAYTSGDGSTMIITVNEEIDISII